MDGTIPLRLLRLLEHLQMAAEWVLLPFHFVFCLHHFYLCILYFRLDLVSTIAGPNCRKWLSACWVNGTLSHQKSESFKLATKKNTSKRSKHGSCISQHWFEVVKQNGPKGFCFFYNKTKLYVWHFLVSMNQYLRVFSFVCVCVFSLCIILCNV